MTHDQLREYCLSLPGAVLVTQWSDDQVYKISGKMFAVTDNACSRISFKCSDETFLLLIEAGIAQPAPYLARAKWVQVAEGTMPDNELCQRLSQAYSIVRAGLTRKAQATLPPFDG